VALPALEDPEDPEDHEERAKSAEAGRWQMRIQRKLESCTKGHEDV